jgi:hypothetical protein
MSWSPEFEDPIPLPRGGDAADYIMKLPPKAQQEPEWQAAVEALLMAAEGREPLMHARIGILRALNAGKPEPTTTPRSNAAKAYSVVR